MKLKRFIMTMFVISPALLLFSGCFNKPKDDPTYEAGINLTTIFEKDNCEELNIEVGYRLSFTDDVYGKVYNTEHNYYSATPKTISGDLSLSKLCFEDVDKSTRGYELKDMIIYFDINNNSAYPVSVNMEIINEVAGANFTFDCESIGYIQEKDNDLSVKTQTAAFRVRYKNEESIKKELKDVKLKLTFEKLTPIADTANVFGWTFDTTTKTAVVSSYNDSTNSITDVKVPRTVINEDDGERYVVTELGKELFKSNSVIKNVYLPDTLTKIGPSAFLQTTALDNIYIPEGVQYISAQAFAKSALKGDLYLPESLIKFDYIFESYLTKPDPENFEGRMVFGDMPNLERVIISEGVEYLPVQAFYKAVGLKEVIFPTTLKDFIGYYNSEESPKATGTFHTCSSLVEVDMYNTQYQEAGRQSFYKCTALKSVYLAKNQKDVAIADFDLCSSLEYVYIPSSMIKLGSFAFSHCPKLKDVELPVGLKEIGASAFSGCKSFQNITIPETVEYIGDAAFNHCCGVKNTTITLPTGIKQIGGESYNAENPNRDIIGSHVFYNCATEKLVAFKIAASNPYYMTIDGVLYRKEDGVPTVLIAYPASKRDSVYVMPNTVVDAYELSLSRPYYLKEIVLSDNFVIREISTTESEYYLNYEWANNLSGMIYLFSGVTKVTCNNTNQNYKSVNGQVYSKDGKVLYYAPMYSDLDNQTMTFAEGVETFFAGALGSLADYTNNSNSDNILDDDKFVYRYDYVIIPSTVYFIDEITLGAINYMGWEITIDSENLFYTVNASGDIEILEAV